MSDDLPPPSPPAPDPMAAGPAAPDPTREPGNPMIALLAGVAVVLLIGVVATLNQWTLSFASSTPAPTAAAAVEPPDFQTEFAGKIMVKIAFESPSFAEQAVLSLEGPADADQTASGFQGPAKSPADRLRGAIAAAELFGPEALRKRLERLEAEVPEDAPLRADVRSVRLIYLEDAVPGEADLEALKTNHGWFGRLAASRSKGDSDPVRQRMVSGGGSLMILLLALFGVACLAFVCGLVLLIIGIVNWLTDPNFRKFRPLPAGGSALIETVAVFIAAFLAMKLGADVVAWAVGDDAALPFTLVAQWALLACVLWGWYRGLPLNRALAHLGWHRGKGVLTEIGCGIIGYLACVPLLVGGVLVSLILLALDSLVRQALGVPEGPRPSNKIIEVLGSQHGTWMIVVVFMLATAWAPIAEESIFRGALYGHLRQRWHWLPAAVLTAIGFGLMHGYPIVLMGGVISLGFGFALIREWRGSIIACATAHAIHNGTVLVLLLTLMRMLAD